METLLKEGLTIENQSMQGIGYKEVLEGIREGYSKGEVVELIKKNTRNYAKRQITFFKRMQNHTVLPIEEVAVENVLKLFK